VFTTASVLPWLLAVANNVVRHRWRSEVRYRQLLERLPMPTASADHADEVATRLDAERDMASVLEALADLAPEDQDVLSLCLWSQLSYADAAAALDVPVGTVRSRLSRARVRLNERIAARAEVTNGRTEEKSP
jgi:RNA polymerase sigma-70 factor (ECF subfamily)